MTALTALILASGFSDRFGSQKLLAPVNGEPMIVNVAKMAASCPFGEIFLIYSDDRVAQAVREIPGLSAIRLIYNDCPEQGQSAAIRLGVAAANPASGGYLFFMGDQPFLQKGTVDALTGAFEKSRAGFVAPVYGGAVRGTPVLFHAKWRGELLRVEGDCGGRQIMRAHPSELLRVPIADARQGIDIDTKSIYEKEVQRRHCE